VDLFPVTTFGNIIINYCFLLVSDMNKDVEPVALFSTPQTPTSSCDTPSALGNNDSLETTVTPKDDLFGLLVCSNMN